MRLTRSGCAPSAGGKMTARTMPTMSASLSTVTSASARPANPTRDAALRTHGSFLTFVTPMSLSSNVTSAVRGPTALGGAV
jgi:hypothetical protein